MLETRAKILVEQKMRPIVEAMGHDVAVLVVHDTGAHTPITTPAGLHLREHHRFGTVTKSRQIDAPDNSGRHPDVAEHTARGHCRYPVGEFNFTDGLHLIRTGGAVHGMR